MTYNQNITLDLNTNTSYVVVGAKQGDYNSRTITATILQNGELCHFGDNTSASYRIRRPDGYGNWAEATILPSRSRIQITLSAADLEVAGRCYADILIKDGSESLGTTNFVIDVQAAPNIADSAVQSQPFSYLQNMVYDADRIIESAQAWTEGKRGTVEAIGDGAKIYTNSPAFDKDGNGNYNFNFEIFKSQIEPLPIGETKVYTFVYTIDEESNGYWQLGNQRIDDISQYGIILNGTPDYNDIIQITASFADPTWHNNAKWYMEALQNASVGTVTTLEPGTPGSVTADYDDEENAFTFNFGLPSVKPHVIADVNTIDAFVTDSEGKVVRDANGEISKNDASVNVTIQSCDENGTPIENENSLHKLIDFQFMVPRGEPAGFSDQQYATVNQRDPSKPPVTSDDNPAVNVRVVKGSPDTAKQFIFDFTIPPGKQGNAGPMPTFTCSVDDEPATQPKEMSVTSTETRPGEYDLHFKLLKGDKGIDGQGSVTKVMGISPVEDTTSQDFGNVLAEKIFDLIYPLDSIYISVNKSFDPETTFGGEWEQIEDVYLYASSSDTIETYYGNINNNKVTVDFEDGFAGLGFNNGAIDKDSGGVGVQVGQLSAEEKEEWALTHVLKVPATKSIYPLMPSAQGITPGPLDNLVRLFGSTTIDIAPGALRVYVWKRIALSDGTRTTLSNQTTPDSNS